MKFSLDQDGPGQYFRRLRSLALTIPCVVGPGEKGGSKVGKTKRGKGTKITAVADTHGLPVGLCI
jgi:hypothetical protein